MRLGAFAPRAGGRVRPGCFTRDGRVIDLEAALAGSARELRADHGPLWWLTSAGRERCGMLGEEAGPCFALEQIAFAPAVPWPGKVIATGRNYQSHVRESQRTWSARGRSVERPPFPSGFIRVRSSLIGHREAILLPPEVDRVDYELELAVVIGRDALRVSEAEALDCVAGYCLCNDVSARAIQLAEMEQLGILVAKNFPGFGPLGPWVTTAEEVADPQAIDLELQVNGEPRQAASTGEMLFSLPEQIAHWSQIGLEPGDVIITGTPSGVALGREQPERYYLREGDEVRLTGTGLGELVNPVRATSS
jgi:2-keto-4-pentenoate hydratase/2-oxohepta-3-ene-1,7-dioic acid hydratase in catechol pathway